MTEQPQKTDELLLVHAYLDGELDPANAIGVERRIQSDPALAAERDRVAALRQALRERVPPKALPPGLARRVTAAVGIGRSRSRPSWTALAASLLVVAALSSATTYVAVREQPGIGIAQTIVDDHLRALMAPQPFEVASSDRHTVKPWFNGRTPQAPRVVDLAQAGFPLAGGRIDVIANTPVPTLVYQHRQHVISLSAIPDVTGTALEAHQSVRGFNLVRWNDGGVAYWAVSDLGAGELDAFVRAFRAAPAD